MLDGIKNRIQKFLLEKATARYEREVYRQMQPYEQWIALHEWKTEKRSETGKETEKETEKITVVRFSECGGAFHVSRLDGEIIVFMDDYGALSSRALDMISRLKRAHFRSSSPHSSSPLSMISSIAGLEASVITTNSHGCRFLPDGASRAASNTF